MIEINIPEVVAEVEKAFARYERALVTNDIAELGRDFAAANAEFKRAASTATGRQSQVWLRTDEGWRVVAAHVSLLTEPQSPSR
jgi:hypothetical protein